jgi:hypothetical protein
MRIRVAIAALVWLCSPALCQNPTFLPTVNYPVQGDGSIATGDFNGDSKPDLVVANQDNTVSILLGNGDGTFQTQRFVTVPQFANYVAVGDFNADNKADLAVISVNSLNFAVPSAVQGTVYILLGNGNGTFGAATSVATATLPRSLAVGDVNQDNLLDLVVANQGDGTVSVLLGNGNGTFRAAVNYPAGSSPEAVAIGDVTGDGLADVVAASNDGHQGFASVLPGNGDGTFGPAVNWIASLPSGAFFPDSVVIGDLDHDGKADIVLAGDAIGVVSVLIGTGGGSFKEPSSNYGQAPVGGPLGSFVVSADFNLDTKPDLAVIFGGFALDGGALELFLGNGDGTFANSPSVIPVGTTPDSVPFSIVSADFNKDGFADLAIVANPGESGSFGQGFNAVSVMLNCGTRCVAITLSATTTSPVFNQAVAYSATVSPGNSSAPSAPTGTVTFRDADTATTLGTAAISGGQANLTSSALAVGAHHVTASYSGDSHFLAAASSPLAITVSQAPAVVSLGASPNPVSPGQAVTFSTQVNASTSGTPGGNVNFVDNGTPSVTLPLDGTGSATFTIATLAAGTHAITWSYSGDRNFLPATSPILTEIVGTSTSPFVFAADHSTASVGRGHSATFNVALTPLAGFKDSVTLGCSGLPVLASCSFAPATLDPQNNNVVTTILTITTTGPKSSLLPSFTGTHGGLFALLAPGLSFGLFALWWLPVSRLRDRFQKDSVLAGFLTTFLIVLVLFWASCGGGGTSSGPSNPSSTPTGSFTVMVTGFSGSKNASLPLTLVVTD